MVCIFYRKMWVWPAAQSQVYSTKQEQKYNYFIIIMQIFSGNEIEIDFP